jgi:hypothetical protein
VVDDADSGDFTVTESFGSGGGSQASCRE